MSALQHPSFEIPCCTRLSAGRLALALESLAPLCPCSAQTLGVVTRALDATPRSQSAFGVRVRRPPSAYADGFRGGLWRAGTEDKGVQPGKRRIQAKDRLGRRRRASQGQRPQKGGGIAEGDPRGDRGADTECVASAEDRGQ